MTKSNPEENEYAVIKILSQENENNEGEFPKLLKSYAMPISMPLREDPPNEICWPERLIPDKTNGSQKQLLKEYKLLISTHQRSGNTRKEAYAHYSSGVVLDNIEEIDKAIDHYLKALQIMIDLEDVEFQTLVYNALGVNYQLLGGKWYEKSAFCHSMHSKLSDVEGKFLAGVNSGLLYLKNGMIHKADSALKAALRFAIEMESDEAQAILLCLQGLNFVCENDFMRASVCMEKYFDISSEADDICGQAKGLLNLGQINSAIKNYEIAEMYFQKCIKAATLYDDVQIDTQAKIALGVLKLNQTC